MNFLHYSILMFVICCLVLIGVSLMTPAPERKKLAGLTFATVDDKMEVSPVRALDHKPAAETAFEHRLNIVFSLALIAPCSASGFISGRTFWPCLPVYVIEIQNGPHPQPATQRLARRSDRLFFLGLADILRTTASGPLKSVADFYIPFQLFRVEMVNAGKRDLRLFRLDAVNGSLDLYSFDHSRASGKSSIWKPPTIQSPCWTKPRPGKLLSPRCSACFLPGLFRVRNLQISAEQVAGEIYIPYWVGFRGRGVPVRFVVMDAVRKDGRRQSAAFVQAWLTSIR